MDLFKSIRLEKGELFQVVIKNGDSVLYDREVPYFDTFGEVNAGEPVIFINSRLFVSIALREAHFADAYHIESGPEWIISLARK